MVYGVESVSSKDVIPSRLTILSDGSIHTSISATQTGLSRLFKGVVLSELGEVKM